MTYYYDFGPEQGGIQPLPPDVDLQSIAPELLLSRNSSGGFSLANQSAPVASAPVGYSSDYVRWAGGPGQPVEYKRPDGTWVSGGAPEHGESASYLQKAFADPQVEQLFKFAYENPNSLNNEQKAFMANVVGGLDSVGQGGRWGNLNLFDNQFNPQQAGTLLGTSYLSDADRSAGSQFNQEQSPAAQSARSESDGFMGLGDIGTLALLAGGAYGLGSLGGLWGAGVEAAGAGALGAGSSAYPGFIDAIGTGVGAGESITGALGAAGAGGSAMDFSNLGDLWNTGVNDLADPNFIDALGGMTDATGTALPEWASANPGLWETVKNLPTSTINALKSTLGNDWMKTIGSLGTAGLNAYASNQQTNALSDMAKRYEGYGAPYRQKLSDLYADPTAFLQSKEVQTPVNLGTQSLMRSLSTQGNPFGSGNALQQGQSYASDQLFSRLGQEKDRLAGFGGLASYNAAAPQASTNAISSGQGPYIGAAKAMGDIFNPPQTPAQQASEWMKAMGR